MTQEWVRTLTDVPTPQLHCMPGGFNHHWDSVTKPHRRGQFGIHINSRCGVCGKERTRIVSSLSERTIQLYYVTPDWHVKVEEPYDAYDVARELARRMEKSEKPGRRLRVAG
jgi:hypothetical protein